MAEHNVTVESTLTALLDEKKYPTVRDILITMNPSDVASILDELPEERLPLLFRLLPKEQAAETFVEMEPEAQELLIRGFSDSELREVLDDPAVAAAEWRALGDPTELNTLLDEVWVYGDPAVHDPVAAAAAAVSSATCSVGKALLGRGIPQASMHAARSPRVCGPSRYASSASMAARAVSAALALAPRHWR